MPWIILLVSAVLEAVWATALGASNGLSELLPSIIFVIGLVLSMLGLGYAAKHIPISTAYAIWTGTGAALTVAWGMLTGAEELSVLRVVFLAGIVGSVIALKLIGHGPAKDREDARADSAV